MESLFKHQVKQLVRRHHELLNRPNTPDRRWYNGLFERWTYPVVTADHVPLTWRYDFSETRNPHLIERIGVNAAFNAGAIENADGSISVCVRVEGLDRKSFFAIADSPNGVDQFRFREKPVVFDRVGDETNLYDMRLTRHEDGWIYGLFCAESHDPQAKPGDTISAVADCGIVRTRDLDTWERLPNLKHPNAQQRNVALHPKFVNGKYMLYTRPMEFFIDAGTEGHTGWGLSDSMNPCVVGKQEVLDERIYHTIKEAKMGSGAAPFETSGGWMHIAHGVRNTAAGLRYVLYCMLCDKDNPGKVIHRPGGYILAPFEEERVGDVSNVLFSNGVVAKADGSVFIYYASSDTRLHVATTTVEKLLDYAQNTPEDLYHAHGSVQQRCDLVDANRPFRAQFGLDQKGF